MYETEVNDSFHSIPESSIHAHKYAMAARSLGVFALFASFFGLFYMAFIAGGIAVILASLSRGSGRTMNRNGRIGMVCAVLALVIQLSVLIIGIYALLYIPEYRMQVSDLYQEMYGQSLDEVVTILKERINLILTGGNL